MLSQITDSVLKTRNYEGKKPHNLSDWYYSEELLNQRTLSRVSMILTEYVCHWQLGWHHQPYYFIFIIFFSFIFISWRLITLQYCSGFCHTLTWISHGVTWFPHPDPPSHLPLYPIPLSLPRAPGPSTCLVHPTWAGDLFHYR